MTSAASSSAIGQRAPTSSDSFVPSRQVRHDGAEIAAVLGALDRRHAARGRQLVQRQAPASRTGTGRNRRPPPSAGSAAARPACRAPPAYPAAPARRSAPAPRRPAAPAARRGARPPPAPAPRARRRSAAPAPGRAPSSSASAHISPTPSPAPPSASGTRSPIQPISPIWRNSRAVEARILEAQVADALQVATGRRHRGRAVADHADGGGAVVLSSAALMGVYSRIRYASWPGLARHSPTRVAIARIRAGHDGVASAGAGIAPHP